MAFSWDELPDFEEVRSTLRRQAEVKAQLRIAELELGLLQATCAQIKPRDSSVKMVGVDDTTRRELERLHRRVVDLNNELDAIDADVRFNDYRRDAAKIMSYKGRV